MNLKTWYLEKIKKVEKIDAENFDEAYAAAKKKGLKDFLWQDKHYTTKYAGSSTEERKAYGITNSETLAGSKIPENEDPIRIFIYPFGGDNMGLTSHAALEYKNRTISYGSKGNDNSIDFTWASETCRVYEIYPSLIRDFKIDTAKLEELIKKQQKKPGEDYKFLRDNCADQCIEVLEGAGAEGIVQPAGIAIPQVLEIWAKKYGHEVSQEQVVDNSVVLHQQFVNNIKALQMKKDPEFYGRISKGYNKDKVRNCIEGLKGRTVGPTRWYQLSKKSENELCERIKEDFRKARNNPKNTQEMVDYIERLQAEEEVDLSVLIENGLNEEIKCSKLYKEKGEAILISPYLQTTGKAQTEANNNYSDAYIKLMQQRHQIWNGTRLREKLKGMRTQNGTAWKVNMPLGNENNANTRG